MNRPMDPGVLFNQTGGGGSICSASAEGLTGTRIGDSGMGTPVTGGGSAMDTASSMDYGGDEPWNGIAQYTAMDAVDGTNRICVIGSFQTCFYPVQTELKALITDRLGFIHGEFDVDRVELTSSYTNYDPTLLPQFTRVDGSGRILSAGVNVAGNLVLSVPSNRWFLEATPTMNAASAVSLLGGEAVASLARIVSIELNGGLAEVEVNGAPEGWETAESYRLFSGYDQDSGCALSDRWSIIASVTSVVYFPSFNITAVSIDGIDGHAGETTDWPLEPSMLNGRHVSLSGSDVPSFSVLETDIDSLSSAITILIDGDASSLFTAGDEITIGASENAYLSSMNIHGSYFLSRDTGNFDNINRQYDPITGIWSSSDPLGIDSSGNIFSYCQNGFSACTDLIGLKFETITKKVIDEFGEDPFDHIIDPTLRGAKGEVVTDFQFYNNCDLKSSPLSSSEQARYKDSLPKGCCGIVVHCVNDCTKSKAVPQYDPSSSPLTTGKGEGTALTKTHEKGHLQTCVLASILANDLIDSMAYFGGFACGKNYDIAKQKCKNIVEKEWNDFKSYLRSMNESMQQRYDDRTKDEEGRIIPKNQKSRSSWLSNILGRWGAFD